MEALTAILYRALQVTTLAESGLPEEPDAFSNSDTQPGSAPSIAERLLRKRPVSPDARNQRRGLRMTLDVDPISGSDDVHKAQNDISRKGDVICQDKIGSGYIQELVNNPDKFIWTIRKDKKLAGFAVATLRPHAVDSEGGKLVLHLDLICSARGQGADLYQNVLRWAAFQRKDIGYFELEAVNEIVLNIYLDASKKALKQDSFTFEKGLVSNALPSDDLIQVHINLEEENIDPDYDPEEAEFDSPLEFGALEDQEKTQLEEELTDIRREAFVGILAAGPQSLTRDGLKRFLAELESDNEEEVSNAIMSAIQNLANKNYDNLHQLLGNIHPKAFGMFMMHLVQFEIGTKQTPEEITKFYRKIVGAIESLNMLPNDYQIAMNSIADLLCTILPVLERRFEDNNRLLKVEYETVFHIATILRQIFVNDTSVVDGVGGFEFQDFEETKRNLALLTSPFAAKDDSLPFPLPSRLQAFFTPPKP